MLTSIIIIIIKFEYQTQTSCSTGTPTLLCYRSETSCSMIYPSPALLIDEFPQLFLLCLIEMAPKVDPNHLFSGLS